MACQWYLSVISVRTQPLKEPKFPVSKIRGGSWARVLIRRALMFLSYLTFQESKKLRFQDSFSLPCPIAI